MLSQHELSNRESALRSAGFSEQNIINFYDMSPTLWSDPDGKIAFLKEQGFANPVKMITSLPAILGLADDNISYRIRFLGRMCKRLDVPITAQELMQKNTSLWSTKREKLHCIIRIGMYYECSKVNTLMSAVVCNLERLLITLAEHPEETVKVIVGLAKKDKRSNGLKDLIIKSKTLHPKITSSYRKGYG